MRIGVNMRLLLKGKLEGIGWFTHQLISRIVRQHPEHEFVFFFDRPYSEDFIFAPNVHPVVLKPQARHPFLYYLWTEWVIPNAIKKYKIDLYYSPEGLGTKPIGIPTCITIHDLTYIHYPDFTDRLHRWHYARYLPKHSASADKIIAVSEFTKNDIIEKYRIEADKIDVVYNSAHSRYQPLEADERRAIKEKYTDGNEYFLFTGALHPRKNIVNLLKAFVYFKRMQQSKMKLVIVGRMAWQYDEIQKAKELMPFKEEVKWLGYIGVEELAKITGAAYALIYPSLFEGFGIPIVEAMKSDVPVIVSNTSSMPEVGGNAALLINPESAQDISLKMQMIYKDERLRKHLIEAGRNQQKKFSWDKSAQKLWDSLMDTYNHKHELH